MFAPIPEKQMRFLVFFTVKLGKLSWCSPRLDSPGLCCSNAAIDPPCECGVDSFEFLHQGGGFKLSPDMGREGVDQLHGAVLGRDVGVAGCRYGVDAPLDVATALARCASKPVNGCNGTAPEEGRVWRPRPEFGARGIVSPVTGSFTGITTGCVSPDDKPRERVR